MKEFFTDFIQKHIHEEALLKVTSLAWRVALAALIFIVTMQLVKLLKKLLKKTFKKFNVDDGIAGFLTSITSIIIYTLVAFAVAQAFGLDAASIVALLGSAGVTIGLAIQGSLANIAGGILILILKPFKVGDYIIEDSKMNEGTVTEIGLIYTKLITLDSKTIVLPNGTLANTSIVNVTHTPYRLIDMKFDIAYDADHEKAKELIKEVIENDKYALKEKPIEVAMDSLESSSVRLCGRFYVKNSDFRLAKWSVLEAVKESFDANGIEIPFTQIVVHENQN